MKSQRATDREGSPRMTQMHALLHSAELHYYKKKKSDFKYQGFLQAVTHRMQCKKKKKKPLISAQRKQASI